MRWSALGLVTGLVAGLALALDGFGAFLIVLLFGAIGLVGGLVADRELDVSRLLDSVRSGGTRGGGTRGGGTRGGGGTGGARPWRRDRL